MRTIFFLLVTLLLVPVARAEEMLPLAFESEGLVAFWDFQETSGKPRLSKGGTATLSLEEKGGAIERAEGGVFGRHAARLQPGQWFQIDRDKIGPLDIHGKDAAVTVIAWTYRETSTPWQAIAGVWDETRKKRQYCLFLNAPVATRSDEMKRYPAANRIHGHVSSVGGGTPGHPVCITYSSGATEIGMGAWHCVAMTYDGANSTVYVDGRLDSWELRNPFRYDEGLFDGGSDGADFTVGAVHRSNQWGNFFGGRIGGLAVFNRALSESEIKKLTDSGEASRRSLEKK
ncbi:MAG TPA: hypothetical protein PLN52_23755 [Opitutaceae bacterium]|nr:hypothetical protein [Opitutaceae bacterium]